MKLAFLALLAFAAPAPLAESFVEAEEEVVVLRSKASKSAVRRIERTQPPVSTCRPTPRLLAPALPSRSLTEWTPSAFTRPPPTS